MPSGRLSARAMDLKLIGPHARPFTQATGRSHLSLAVVQKGTDAE
jgi:hypothetical protein